LTFEAWIVALLVVVILFGLWKELASPSLLVFGGVVFLLAVGIISPTEAFSGFSNPAPITVAALFVVARAVSKTGALDRVTKYLLGNSGDTRRPMLRMLTPTVTISGFVNNIPLVAMLVPQVSAWAKRRGVDSSTYLLPLSFGAILGGMLTVIGTSTNLVVSGQMIESGLEPLSFFETGLVGLPIALAGVVVTVAIAPRVLGARKSARSDFEEGFRDYTIEMTVAVNGPADGVTVEAAGLRQLEGVFLASVDRGEESIAPATPTTTLRGGDTLRFVGQIENILDLQRLPGITFAEQGHIDQLDHPSVHYFTVVIGADSDLVGQTLKEFGFRRRYQSAVIAIHRAGHRLDVKLGDVDIRVGDSLVVIADPGFADRWRNRSDFLLIAAMDESITPVAPGAGITLLTLGTMIVLAAIGVVPILVGALVAALFLVAVGVLTPDEARRGVDLEVIGLIASAFGLAAAVDTSGLAAAAADGMVDMFGGFGQYGVLLGVILVTITLTELVTNNATALLMLPLAIAAAPASGVDPRGMAVAVAIGASASFLTPIGYQTNTMVYGPGGYKFRDYVRLGAPLTIITIIVLMVLIPIVYPA
jgi:di/tricarboxylate transporter